MHRESRGERAGPGRDERVGKCALRNSLKLIQKLAIIASAQWLKLSLKFAKIASAFLDGHWTPASRPPPRRGTGGPRRRPSDAGIKTALQRIAAALGRRRRVRRRGAARAAAQRGCPWTPASRQTSVGHRTLVSRLPRCGTGGPRRRPLHHSQSTISHLRLCVRGS